MLWGDFMSYIAFLDLLGTKNLSTDDATSYSKSISIFTNCLQRSLVEGCEAYAFSDCAYLEASTLSQIVSTLYTLRAELLMQQRFFVAAVACGTLNASVVDSIDKNFKYKDERGNNYGIKRNLYTASCP